MAKRGRKADAAKRSDAPVYVAAAVVLVTGAGLVLALTGNDDPALPSTDGPCTYTPVSEFRHVHGLVAGADGFVYVATHHGLFRGNASGWTRVGSTTDDLMGFTMDPGNASIAWSSGHPASGFGNMGVRRSADGGCTWERIALEGVDFHAMTVSRTDPDRLWGHYQGEVYRSTDGGSSWDVVAERPPRVASLASDPADADLVYASGPDGVARSRDGGATWATWKQGGAAAVAIDPRDPRVAVVSGSGLEKTVDGGESWTALEFLPPEGPFSHLAFDETGAVYGATAQGGVYGSSDGGLRWRTVKPASS
ncbi:MAG: WD40/YVTN/BNR-like repeat-containing protein [Methanobacteriota archaeon]